MGETRRYTKHKRWTKEEEEKLIQYSERMTESGLAKLLNRPITSVRSKRARMGLPCFAEQTDKVNCTIIAELVGVDRSNIHRVWVNKGLNMERVGQFKVVEEKELARFMKEHPELWKASKCDYYYFCHYDWFVDRLKREREGLEKHDHYKDFRYWTAKEISRAKMLKRRGLSHREIGKELGRSKQAIDHASRRGYLT